MTHKSYHSILYTQLITLVTSLLVTVLGSMTLGSMASFATDLDDINQMLTGLKGHWTGNLEYRDYRSNKRVFLPMVKKIHIADNGSYLLAENIYTDPGYKVYSAEMMIVRGNKIILGYPAKKDFETSALAIQSIQKRDQGWSLVLSEAGQDDNRPAEIRYHWTLTADKLTVEKQVRHSKSEAFEFRNKISLTRDAMQTAMK